MGTKTPRTIDIWGTKTYTVIMTMRNSGDTANNFDCYFSNTGDGGATVTNNNTSSITIQGLSSQVNTAVNNTYIVPNADVTGSYSFNWAQTDNDPTPGSNAVNANLPLNINTTHNEWSINTPLTYNEDEYAVWDLGSITDTRPDNIDAGIQYTITATLSTEDAGILGGPWVDQTGGVYNYTSTKTNCNSLLGATNFLPKADYIGSFSISYDQQQITDSKDHGSTVINFSALVTHAEHSITAAQTYSTDTTATWNLGSITDKRPDNIDSDILYTMTALLYSVGIAGDLTGWDSVVTEIIKQSDDINAGDTFGYDVAMDDDGNTVVISATEDSDLASGEGSAYIFTRSGDTWTQQEKLTADDGVANDKFGDEVAISGDGDTVLVSSFDGAGSGAVYFYKRTGTSWTQEQKLVAPTREVSAYFGNSISITPDGNNVILGANAEDITETNGGAAYIFTRSGDTWTQQQRIVSSDLAAADNFGMEVAISADANTCMVAAKIGSNTGAVYVFTKSGSTWTQQQKLTPSTNASDDRFGHCISLSADGTETLITKGGDNAMYYFTESGGTWTEQQEITSITEGTHGQSLDVNSSFDIAIVGAHGYDTGVPNDGAAVLWSKVGSVWSDKKIITASDGLADDQLGFSVSISGDGKHIVSSANRYSNYTGKVYFDIIGTKETFTGTKAQCNTELASVEFVPDTGYADPFIITYSQNQDTDNKDQGSTTINVTNV